MPIFRNPVSALRVSVAVAAVGCAAACATPNGHERVNAEIAGRLAKYEETGVKSTCLPMRRIVSIDAASENKFLFRVGVDEYWLNETGRGCIGATRRNNRMQYETSLSQLCRNDIMRIVDNFTNMTQGSCGLGTFKQLKAKEAAAASE